MGKRPALNSKPGRLSPTLKFLEIDFFLDYRYIISQLWIHSKIGKNFKKKAFKKSFSKKV